MKRWLAVLATAGTFAACGSSSAAPSAGTRPAGCGPRGAHTLAHDALARVYSLHGSVYGCAVGARHSYRLAGTGPCPGTPQLGPVALARRIAAYALRSCGVDTSTAEIVVRRLSTGQRLSVHPAIDAPTGPESFQSVGSIAVRASGSVAWIASSSSIATHRANIEVLAVAGGTERRLDSGSGIEPRSLRLADSTLSWTDAGAKRSARLG